MPQLVDADHCPAMESVRCRWFTRKASLRQTVQSRQTRRRDGTTKSPRVQIEECRTNVPMARLRGVDLQIAGIRQLPQTVQSPAQVS